MNNVNLSYGRTTSRSDYRKPQSMGGALFIALFFSVASLCSAQVTNVTDVTSTPIPGVGHDYIGRLSDTVTPANGAVSLRIPVPVPTSRGFTTQFSFTYDSNGVHFIAGGSGGYAIWNRTPTYLTAGGWSYTIPQLTYTTGLALYGTVHCQYRTAYVFQDNLGTRYPFPMADNLSGGNGSCPQSTTVYKTAGPYAANLVASQYFAIDDPDGTVYAFANSAGAGCPQQSTGSNFTALPSSIEDRNGNVTTVSWSPSTCDGSFQVTDTAGRPILASSGFGTTGNTLTVSGLSSPYQLTWATENFNFSVNASPSGTEPPYCNGAAGSTSGTQTVMTSLTLPNNQVYHFHYGTDTSTGAPSNPYGLLNEIVYPNGGYVQYAWGINPLAQDVEFPAAENDGTCEYHVDSIAVLHRYVSYDGSKVALQQDFQYATNWVPGEAFPSLWSTKTTLVTNTDNIAATVNSTLYTYSGSGTPEPPYIGYSAGSQIPLEQSVVYKDGKGDTLQTVTKKWQDPYALTNKTTTLPNNSSSIIADQYGTRDQVIEEDDTDYGQSALTRKTLYTYQTFAPVPQFSSANSSIVGRPCKVLREDGSSNVNAEQDLFYDGGTTVCGTAGTPSVTTVSGLPTGTHDPKNYSISSATARGNLTTYTQKCLQNCQNATTTYTYDMTGQATSKTDPCGNATCSDVSAASHKTTYVYTDSPSGGNSYGNSNTYVTMITDPLGHSSDYSYNYPIGVLTGSTDANKETTTYKYGTEPSQCSETDLLNRLTEVDYPDGGITEYCYNDAVPSVETAKLILGSTWETNVATMDGMNHVTETELTSDPSNPDIVLMTYDGEGRIYTKTNPYRTTSDPTYGITTYQYDAISRPVSVQNPDKSFQYWCYDGIASAGQKNCRSHVASITGDWLDFADEKGNDWQKTTDSFGRLTNVIEPNGAATYYSYNILDNLVCAAQDGGAGGTFSSCAAAPAAWRPRSFTYDSLSRLIQSFNPETGWICYGTSGGAVPNGSNCTVGYDANGNLASKTDARDITTSYAYDALNRLLSKRFSNDPGSTPSSCYQYDSSSLGVGRLGSEWSQSASAGVCAATAPSTGLWTRRSILSYDAMGRVLSEQQCTPSNCSSTPYSPAYTFDKAGNQYTATNGITSTPSVGTLSFTSPFDGAGRLLSVSSNWNDPTHPPGLFSAQSQSAQPCPHSLSAPYTAFGGLTNATYGGGLTLNRGYDVRLRTTCETDTGSLLKNSTSASATVTVTGTEQVK